MFAFNFKTTLQATAFLLEQTPNGRMNYTKLIKLLYIADRESLQDTGEPITGDQIVAMSNGPVLSRVYDLIKGVIESAEWRGAIGRDGYHVVLGRPPGQGLLCEYEIGKLSEVWGRYKDKSYGQMIDIVHEFEEWKKNDPGESKRDIPLDDILEALGLSDIADEIKEEAIAQCAHAQLLGQ